MPKSDQKEIKKQNLIKSIQDNTKSLLIPNMQNKMKEVVDYIKANSKEDLNTIQIMSLIAKKSLSEITVINCTYTPQEIAIAFNIYLDMINEINKIKKFPPTIHSFTTLLGITPTAFNNWRADPEKREICNYIHSFFVGSINEATLLNEINTIAGIYTTKTMGLIEQQAPTVIEYKKTTDIDKIQEQLKALNNGIIDAEYEEVGEKDE
jgi:hypothetical protein